MFSEKFVIAQIPMHKAPVSNAWLAGGFMQARGRGRTYLYPGIGPCSWGPNSSSSTTVIAVQVSQRLRLAALVSVTVWCLFRYFGNRAMFTSLPGILRMRRGSKARLRNIGYVLDWSDEVLNSVSVVSSAHARQIREAHKARRTKP